MARRRTRVALTGLALSLLLAPAASAQAPSKFGEIFPNLPPLNSQTAQQLADLAQTQSDPNLDSSNNCTVPTTPGPPPVVPPQGCVFTGFTYLGQFLDHDLTLDTSPSPTAPVDPSTLTNSRTFALDLDSMYGGGPTGSPQLYAADGKHFLVQTPNVNGVRDLPRNADGSAILVEKRNDENQILAQLHVAMLSAHNKFVDQGMTFAQARAALTGHYQRMIQDDYLPHIMSMTPKAAEKGLKKAKDGVAKLLRSGMTPIEFSVASFRFGHTQVRRAYRLNGVAAPNCGNLQVFAFANPTDSLMGGRTIQANRQINWGNFFEEFPEAPGCEGLRNIGRKIDPLISTSLFQLPIPGAEAAGDNVLAFRNMIRAKFYDMPSGQEVAKALGLPVLTDAELNIPATFTPPGGVARPLAPAFANGVPLWYYILAESSLKQDGQRLGAVGSILNGATFSELLPNGNSFKPDPAIAGPDGKVQMADLIRFADVVK